MSRLLVVEDDPDITTALRLLSTLHIDRPDLIVCDQAMSWLDEVHRLIG